ncbi:MAG: hypothetical protein HN730_08220, partial [Bdellovibrionales bacterium]|nr:hypothetical protein [Bdellovibrionales bacterium]
MLGVINSCALLRPVDTTWMQQEDLLATTLAKICLSGEGSGVLKFRSQQHTFTFETLMNRQQMQWGVAIQVPFHGEELIRL